MSALITLLVWIYVPVGLHWLIEQVNRPNIEPCDKCHSPLACQKVVENETGGYRIWCHKCQRYVEFR